MTLIGSRAVRAGETGIGAPSLVAFVADQATENIIKNLVQEQLMTFSVVRRGSAKDAAAFLKSSASPRTLIMDVSGSDVPLTDVDNLMSMCDPNAVVIVIGESNDIGLYRDMTLLGVSDYVVKPITTEILRRVISIRMGGAQQAAKRTRTGKLVCVTGARGGVGVTTFVANLSWQLSNGFGRRCGVVDLDLHLGAVSLMLGLRKAPGFMDALRNPHRIDPLFLDRTLVKKSEKLFVLSAEEPIETSVDFDIKALDTIFEELAKRFHYVLIDLPRRPGDLYRNVLERAQVRIIMASPTITSVREVIRITRMIGREDLGQRAFLILSHMSPSARAEISRVDFEKAVGRRVDFEIPFARTALAADNGGLMLSDEDPDIKDVFEAIVNDLSGRPPAKGSLVKRLLGGG